MIHKIIVIGGAGYIGSHVVKALMKQQYDITVFDNLSTGLKQNLFEQNKFIEGDILDKLTLDSVFSIGFDACIHIAGLKSVYESMIYPEKYTETNINVLGNTCDGVCLRQLNTTVSLAQVTAILNGNTYNGEYVSGSIVPEA